MTGRDGATRYAVEIVHVRATPVRHELRHRSNLWFVDIDDLPRAPRGLRWLGRFESRDHAGDPAASLRANVDAYLAENGIDLRGGRVTMLANARAFGYVFNPLSLFWCHDLDGAVVCVVAEVRNTYGQAHRYLLHVDESGRAETEKQFYVSPFYPVDGYYRMSLPEPSERLAISVTLHRPTVDPRSSRPSVAPRPPRRAVPLFRDALRHPFETWRVRAADHEARNSTVAQRAAGHAAAGPEDDKEKTLPRQDDSRRAASHSVAGRGGYRTARAHSRVGRQRGRAAQGPVLVIRVAARVAAAVVGARRARLGTRVRHRRHRGRGAGDCVGHLADGFRQVWACARSQHRGQVRLRPRAVARAATAAARLGALGPAPKPPASEARLSGRLHTARRDRAAIAHHYDLSNDFYALLLDETMAYSSAYFTSSDSSLADAQRAKLDLICRKLDLRPGMTLLDVGCGWGSLILHAAENYGVHATGVTLSEQQRDHIAKQIADRGLADRVTVRLQDYRELAGSAEQFDAVSSIEMGEHVGEEQYPVYAGILFAAVKPDGTVAAAADVASYRRGARWRGVHRVLHRSGHAHAAVGRRLSGLIESAGFEIRDVEAMREHYVRTVQCWIDTFEATLRRGRRAGRRRGRSGVAALPGRGGVELRGRANGC